MRIVSETKLDLLKPSWTFFTFGVGGYEYGGGSRKKEKNAG